VSVALEQALSAGVRTQMQRNGIGMRHLAVECEFLGTDGSRHDVGGGREEHAMEIVADGAVLVLRGDFDARSTFKVRDVLYGQLAAYGDVVVDLSGVTVVDMTALRLLAAASRRTAHDGHHLTLRACSPVVLRMLHLSRLARVVELERPGA